MIFHRIFLLILFASSVSETYISRALLDVHRGCITDGNMVDLTVM